MTDAIERAEQECYALYGDRVSVAAKNKYLRKFGRTQNADAGVKTTVALFQDAVISETFATTNSIDYVVSTSASDAAKPFSIEGQKLSSNGTDKIFTAQTVTLNGTTPVALPTPLIRATRGRGTTSDLAGNIAVYDSTLSGGGLTSGKPDVDAAVKLLIAAGNSFSEKCATTVSYRDYWFIEQLIVSVSRNSPQGAVVDIDVEIRRPGGIWVPAGLEITLASEAQNTLPVNLSYPIIVPKNSDVRLIALSDAADTFVTGSMAGPLALAIEQAEITS